MLEKPDIPDQLIITCLRNNYGLSIAEIAFLPIGYDLASSVYRVVTADQTSYFLKLRSGALQEASVAIPRFFNDQGIQQVVAPIATNSQTLWCRVGAFNLILYPFIEGRNGMEVGLSNQQWVELGVALKAIHTTKLPAELLALVPRETYDAAGRELVRRLDAQIMTSTYSDPFAAELAAFWKLKRQIIIDLVDRAERLGRITHQKQLDYILCHSDIHTANVLLDNHGGLFIVDWDSPIMAAKERDLMFVGAAIDGATDLANQERYFYQGYGETAIDNVAFAYYRYERIVQDIAVTGEHIFLTSAGGDETRADEIQTLMSQFKPGAVIDVAYKSDPTSGCTAE